MKANTLSKAMLFSVGILTSNLTFWNEEIYSTKQDVCDILNQDEIDIYNKSIEKSWITETNFFKSYFNITCQKDFVWKIKEIQKQYNLKQDWVMWGETLKAVYLNIYAKDLTITDENVLKRLKIYKELTWYVDINWALYHNLNAFKKMTYYWEWVGENIPWTFINENLANLVPYEIDEKINIIKTWIVEGKHVALFYVEWKLYVATYISPWIPDKKSTKTIWYWERNMEKLHISSSYPEFKKTVINEFWETKSIIYKKWWAVMPYAVNIIWSEYLHWSPEQIDWNPHSHWCSRTPLFYMYEIYNKVKELWKNNVIIDTKSMYSELKFETDLRYANNKK